MEPAVESASFQIEGRGRPKSPVSTQAERRRGKSAPASAEAWTPRRAPCARRVASGAAAGAAGLRCAARRGRWLRACRGGPFIAHTGEEKNLATRLVGSERRTRWAVRGARERNHRPCGWLDLVHYSFSNPAPILPCGFQLALHPQEKDAVVNRPFPAPVPGATNPVLCGFNHTAALPVPLPLPLAGEVELAKQTG
jgi:hypothetical protein